MQSMQSFRDTRSGDIKQLLSLELFITAIVPVAAVLILTVIGIRIIPAPQAGSFLVAFTFCAIGSFLGVCFIMQQIQQTIRKRMLDLISSCRAYVDGQKEVRASVYGRDEFAILATEINRILNMQAVAPPQPQQRPQAAAPAPEMPGTRNTPPPGNPLHDYQLKQLLEDISPVMDGDLRVRARATAKGIGTIADTINFLVEELTQQVKQIRSASDHILSATRDLLDRSIDMAQTSENQMELLMRTTEQVEKLVAFTQRLTGALIISAEAAEAVQRQLQRGEQTLEEASEHISQLWQILQSLTRHQASGQKGQPLTITSITYQRLQQEVRAVAVQLQDISSAEALRDIQTGPDATTTVFSHLHDDVQRQLQLLASVEHTTEEKVSDAEEVITELYTLARRIHQASMGVMNAAERVSSLAVLADDWRSTTASFTLPGEEQRARTQIFEESNDLGSTSPFSSSEKQHTM